MSKTHNCYQCQYRASVPGSAHSSCQFLSKMSGGDGRLLEIAVATGMAELNNKETGDPIIKLNPHGVKNGWATWPIDFDPIWVDDCKFYEAKKP